MAASYKSVLDQLLFPDPAIYTNLKQPYEYDSFRVDFMGPDGSVADSLTLDTVYPFHTVGELMALIYEAQGGDDSYHPIFQCLALPAEDQIQPLHIQHKRLNVKGSTVLLLDNPFTQVNGPLDDIFVDLAGNRSSRIETTSLNDMLLETVLFRTGQKEYVVQCYLYSTVLEAFTGTRRPIGNRDWYGRFAPYFPMVSRANEDGSLPDLIAQASPKLLERTKTKVNLIQNLDIYLQARSEDNVPMLNKILGETTPSGDPAKLRNYRYLRFAWTPTEVATAGVYEPFRLETVFFEMPVSKDVPYMRFWPKTNSPLSKVHVHPITKRPSIEQPEILLEWAGKKTVTLTPEEDCMMIKILLKEGEGSIPPLYGTIYMFEDGSAKLILQPNKETNRLSTRTDLADIGELLDRVMATVPPLQPREEGTDPINPFTPSQFTMEDCYALIDFPVDPSERLVLTQDWFKDRLLFFSPFFQLTTSPIQELNPIVFLRYKLMDNFRISSRDFQFLHRTLDLLKLSGSAEKQKKQGFEQLVEYYSREYTVSEEVAKARVLAYYKEMTDIEKIVSKDTTTFKLKTNPGLDIALFKDNKYVFHLYRISSLTALIRIKTLLSLLLTADVFDEEAFPPDSLASAEKYLVRKDKEDEREADREAEREMLEGDESADGSALRAEALEEAVLGEENEAGAAAPGLALGDDLDNLNLPAFDAEEEEGEAAAAAAPAPPLAALAAADALEGEEGEDEGEDAAGAGAVLDEAGELVITNSAQLKYLTPATYFGQRLLFYDRKLFSWSAKGSTSTKGYPGMCASNALKQPTVLSEEDYEQMKKIYAIEESEGRIQWIEYPKPKDKKYEPPAKAGPAIKTEQITVMRYGSNQGAGEANYYICSTYWCIRDSIILLEQDFENAWDHTGPSEAATKWRTDYPNKLPKKGKNQCPYCGGGLVQKEHRKVHMAEETVIERIKQKSGKQKRHSYIGFLTKKGLHPDGYYLPCCFTKDPDKENALILERHPAFEPLRREAARSIAADRPAAVVARGVKREEAGVGQPDIKEVEITFKRTLLNIENEYILTTDTHPLGIKKNGAPQLSVLSPVVDRYFAQQSVPGLVKQQHTQTKLLRDGDNRVTVSGFLRMAVDNRIQARADSFLNAVAPYYGYTSGTKFKTDLKYRVIAPVFIQLNYGSTLFDFYDPETSIPSVNTQRYLENFAKQIHMPIKRGVEFNNQHTDTLIRAFKSYLAFGSHFTDSTIIKEYRIFGQLLTQQAIFDENERGVLFIVLELNDKNELMIRCPPYGVNREAAARCDYAFLLHYTQDNTWEPVFYTNYSEEEDERTNIFVFKNTPEERPKWPKIVETRVKEFQTLCYSSGLGLYTQIETGLDIQTVLFTLSEVRDLETPKAQKKETAPEDRVFIKYVLRDLYNRVNGVVISIRGGKLITVPCIDDGIIWNRDKEFDVQLDFRNTLENLATFQETQAWYAKFVTPHIQKLKGPHMAKRLALYTIGPNAYKTLNPASPASTVNIPLAQLGGPEESGLGLYIPVAASEGLPVATYDSVPWLIESDILFGSKEPAARMEMSFQEFQEIFEHLRYTFSNWLAVNPEVKERLEKLLFDPENGYTINRTIPYWRKRHELHTLLGPEIRKWLSYDVPSNVTSSSFRRIDCRVQKEETCTNRCVWKEGKGCFLHAPNQYVLGKGAVDAKKLLIAKLIEELIQFPVQRYELLNKRVYQYERLKKPIYQKDQYLVPESVPAWDTFLRMSWKVKDPERKKFYEEYTAIQPFIEDEPEEEGGAPPPEEDEEENETPLGEAGPGEDDDEEGGAAGAAGTEDEEEQEALSEPPAEVKAQFGEGLFWMPLGDEGNTLWDRLTMLYGLEEDELREKGQVEEASAMTLETMKALAASLRLSILQYDLTAPSPEDQTLVVWAKDAAGLKKEFFILIVLEDGSSGLLSSANEVEDIKPVSFGKLRAVWKSTVSSKKEHQVALT